MSGFLCADAEFVLAQDSEFAFWSTGQIRTMAFAPAGRYLCTNNHDRHTHETVVSITQQSRTKSRFNQKNKLWRKSRAWFGYNDGLKGIVIEQRHWFHSYVTGRQYCYQLPFNVGDTVDVVRSGETGIISAVWILEYKIYRQQIHGWPEASYTLEGSSTRRWHHELKIK